MIIKRETSMKLQELEKKDFWRAIILYGRNESTYKMALGKALIQFCKRGKTHISKSELAEAFFDLYLERLKNGKPQVFNPHRTAVVQTIIESYQFNQLDREKAIKQIESQAFHDVIHRFHNVYNQKTPIQFYEHNKDGLIIHDHLYEVIETESSNKLEQEIDSRWSLLESAFEIKRNHQSRLINDIKKIYLINGYGRTNITKNRPVLNSYQNGVCFYCGEIMKENDIHIDHVIPRKFINHDEIWNLVLAHSFCNQQKSDFLPSIVYIYKLIERNEHFIESNHPIKEKLIEQLGNTRKKRMDYVLKVYDDAKTVLGITWEGIKGYHPETDPFYRNFVRYIQKI